MLRSGEGNRPCVPATCSGKRLVARSAVHAVGTFARLKAFAPSSPARLPGLQWQSSKARSSVHLPPSAILLHIGPPENTASPVCPGMASAPISAAAASTCQHDNPCTHLS